MPIISPLSTNFGGASYTQFRNNFIAARENEPLFNGTTNVAIELVNGNPTFGFGLDFQEQDLADILSIFNTAGFSLTTAQTEALADFNPFPSGGLRSFSLRFIT